MWKEEYTRKYIVPFKELKREKKNKIRKNGSHYISRLSRWRILKHIILYKQTKKYNNG